MNSFDDFEALVERLPQEEAQRRAAGKSSDHEWGGIDAETLSRTAVPVGFSSP